MRLIFAFIAFLSLFVSAACTHQPGDTTHEVEEDQDFERIDWGQKIDLDEILKMAKDARIREIQWHVMPNVIRVQAWNGRIFHFRNENRGVDLRNMLIDAGVKIGKGGISFRHVF